MATVGNSLSSAVGIFGGNKLSDLYRGGGNVPNYASYNGVDTGGAGLALSQLQSLVYPVAQGGNVSDARVFATARIDFNSAGTFTNSASSNLLTWLLYGSGSQFQIYLAVTSSAPGFTSSTLNTWISMGAFVSQPSSTGFLRLSNGTWAIRETQSGLQVASGNWDLESDYS